LTEQAETHPAQVPDPDSPDNTVPSEATDPPNNALPTQTSDPPAGTLTSILNSLHETILELQHAVTGSGKRMEQGTKNGPFKARRFGLKKDQATQDPFAGMC
jgi:hypothetical protein